MKIYKLFLDVEKEEKWLEHMSSWGYQLKRITALGAYQFDKGEKEERRYRVDYRSFKKKEDMEDYITLFEDSGWKCAYFNKNAHSYYFYTTDLQSNEDIFSDDISRGQRYVRLAKYISIAYIPLFAVSVSIFMNGEHHFGKAAYFTPGLWKMKGMKFWGHFLFETPFALMRNGLILLIFALIPLYIYLKGSKLCKKGLKESGI